MKADMDQMTAIHTDTAQGILLDLELFEKLFVTLAKFLNRGNSLMKFVYHSERLFSETIGCLH